MEHLWRWDVMFLEVEPLGAKMEPLESTDVSGDGLYWKMKEGYFWR